MPKCVLNLLIVILIEAVTAVVTYLKDLLMGSLNRSDDTLWANHPEFA